MAGRFAPTPSGRMHIGNVYAMLAAWLSARSRGERMLLRIEDVDKPRVIAGADRLMMDDLRWLGLDWDNAASPMYQSRRTERYEYALDCLRKADGNALGVHFGCSHDTERIVSCDASRDVSRDVSRHAEQESSDVAGGVPKALGSHDAADADARSERSGVVYPCFCSRADIRAASAPNEGDGFMVYPGTCRRLLRDHPEVVRERLARGDQHSVRIAMPEERPDATMPDTSLSGSALPDSAELSAAMAAKPSPAAAFDDAVYGPQAYDLAREVGDSVIRRADGLFGYQLVVVVDDLDMGVDDIVRGRDLLRSTALQMWIRRCLLAGGFQPECSPGMGAGDSSACPSLRLDSITTDATRLADAGCAAHVGSASGRVGSRLRSPVNPAYAHLPLIDNAAGRRLAKRERSLDMGALRARGIAPEQVIGYCAWLLRVRPTPEPCTAAELVSDFSWTPLRVDHPDRALDPSAPLTPSWLAEALSV